MVVAACGVRRAALRAPDRVGADPVGAQAAVDDPPTGLAHAEGLVPDRSARRGAAGDPVLPRHAQMGGDGRIGRGGKVRHCSEMRGQSDGMISGCLASVGADLRGDSAVKHRIAMQGNGEVKHCLVVPEQ